MKKRHIIILAAVGALLAASCQKPQIENPLEGGAAAPDATDFIGRFDDTKATLDRNRVQVWSEGDEIGITTAVDANLRCTIKDKSAGTFNGEAIEGGSPYYAVYPYSAENTFTDGVLTATLPAEQVVGSGEQMVPGVMVAACKSDSRTLAFNNCVALLQLTIPRDDIKSVEIAATAEGQYLAGEFTMALEGDEALKPKAVTGEGATPSQSVVLKAEGDAALAVGTYYVAVLPGTLSGLQLTFTNSAGESVAVKKTAAITIGRSAGIDLGNFFEYNISTANELIEWARQTSKSTKWDVVNITRNIALSASQASSYVQAHEFKGEFNGGGKTISGLVTPLFGSLRGAYVHDITVDANVTLTAPLVATGATAKLKGTDYGVGLLAHYAYADQGVETPMLKNVTTKGSLTVNFTGTVSHNYLVGGIVGGDNNVPIEGCTNKASVRINALTTAKHATDASQIGSLYVGGICGANQSGVNATITGCTNEGAVEVSGNVTLTDPATASTVCSVSGISGRCTKETPLTECTNSGAVTNSAARANTFYTSGICSRLEGTVVTVTSCTNSGAILDNSAYATNKEHNTAGIAAYALGRAGVDDDTKYISFTSCVNTGDVTGGAASVSVLRVSGICAYTANHANFTDCTNGTAPNSSVMKATGCEKTSSSCYVSGILANSNKANKVTGCTNYAKILNECMAKDYLRIGGIVANSSNTTDSKGTQVLYDGCRNFGDIQDASGCDKEGRCGGIVGSSTNGKITVRNCENYGNILSSSTVASARLSGILGYVGNSASSSVTSCISKASITGGTAGKCGEIVAESIVATGFRLCDNRIAGEVNGTAVTAGNCSGAGILYGAVHAYSTISGNTLYNE